MVRREAPGDRQHEGEGPHPERQLRLLQPAGAHPHRALGQEAQQDRDSEAGRIVGKINVGAVWQFRLHFFLHIPFLCQIFTPA